MVEALLEMLWESRVSSVHLEMDYCHPIDVDVVLKEVALKKGEMNEILYCWGLLYIVQQIIDSAARYTLLRLLRS